MSLTTTMKDDMNIKQMAAVRTAKLLGAMVLGAVAVNLALEFYPTVTKWTALAAVFGYLVWNLYEMNLNRLESENTLKKLKDIQ